MMGLSTGHFHSSKTILNDPVMVDTCPILHLAEVHRMSNTESEPQYKLRT